MRKVNPAVLERVGQIKSETSILIANAANRGSLHTYGSIGNRFSGELVYQYSLKGEKGCAVFVRVCFPFSCYHAFRLVDNNVLIHRAELKTVAADDVINGLTYGSFSAF